MEIGTKIRELREARRWSQEALAGELQVSRQAVTKWENGLSLPSTANLLALSRVLDVPMAELTGGSPPAGRRRGRRLCLGLAAASLASGLLTLLVWLLGRRSALPAGVIGYADGETGILVTGAPLGLCLLCGVTGALVLATVGTFLWMKYRGGEDA